MKTKLSIMGMVVMLALVACTTNASRLTYNTLASVGMTTRAAFDGYLDLVIAGTVSTNSVPKVGLAYDTFQSAYSVAILAAQLGSNAPVTPTVMEASAKVLTTINDAKKVK